MIDRPWFKSNDYIWSYPSTKEGFIVLITWIILTAYIFRIIDKNSHSVSDTLISFIIPFVLLVILLILIFLATGKTHRSRYINIG